MKLVFYSLKGQSTGLAYRCLKEGNEVWLHIEDKKYASVLTPVISRACNLQEIAKIKPDYVIFDAPGFSDKARTLNKLGIKTLFSTLYADKMAANYDLQVLIAKQSNIQAPRSGFKGINVLVQVWFQNGEPAYPGICILRTTRFLTGNLGPNTQCQGSIVFPFKTKEPKLMQVHKKSWPALSTLKFTGPWTLEVTVCGNEIYFKHWHTGLVFNSIYALREMSLNDTANFLINKMNLRKGFGYSVAISVQPYPSPVINHNVAKPEVRFPENQEEHIYWNDVLFQDGKPFVAGTSGLVCVATSYGEQIDDAHQKMKDLLYHIRIPDKQYRIDTSRIAERDYKKLTELNMI